MRELVIRPMEHSDVVMATELLRTRHETHLLTQPLLNASPDFEMLVGRELERGQGVVGEVADELVGFLIGVPGDGVFGPHVMYQAHGAVFSDPTLVGLLWGELAQSFLAEGKTEHYVFVPDLPEQVSPWFNLDFGTSAVQAARTIERPAVRAEYSQVDVRPGTSEDLRIAATLNREMDLHIQRPPSFGTAPVGSIDEYVEEWATTWEDAQFHHLVAEVDGAVVGQVLLYRRPQDNLRVPSGALDLAQAYVQPELRRRGVMRALMEVSVNYVADQGGSSLITDWRAGNIPAAHVWPAYGFIPTFRRLHRSVRAL